MKRLLGAVATGAAGALLWRLVRRVEPPDASPRPWKTAAAMGLLTSTLSTLFVTLGARRIGRDVKVDWMEVSMSYFGRHTVHRRPSAASQAGGVLVHQTADFAWAVIFYAVLWPWVRRLGPRRVALAGGPWALATSAVEYYLLLPWLQPWVPMQVPFWVASSVHVVSAAGYPLFPLLDPEATDDDRAFAQRWAMGLAVALAALASTAAYARARREPRLPGRDYRPEDADLEFLQHMTAHHEVGLHIAEMAADRAEDRELRTLSELMAAEHAGELDLMREWWRSWVGGAVPPLDEATRQQMVGMPPWSQIELLRAEEDGTGFDSMFLQVMLRHHEGAVVMCDRVLEGPRDPRVDLLARGIRHSQLRQMELMRRILRRTSEDGSARVPFDW